MDNKQIQKMIKYLNKWSRKQGSRVRFRIRPNVHLAIQIYIDDPFCEEFSQEFHLNGIFYRQLKVILQDKFKIKNIEFDEHRTTFWSTTWNSDKE